MCAGRGGVIGAPVAYRIYHPHPLLSRRGAGSPLGPQTPHSSPSSPPFFLSSSLPSLPTLPSRHPLTCPSPNVAPVKLVLFDLDGTLLRTEGLGRRVVSGVLTEQLGRPVDPFGASFAGKTDPQIFRELLVRERDLGAALDDIDTAIQTAIAAYQTRMADAILDAVVTALPGAHAVVKRLADDEGVLLGLLTGNLERIAYAKLARAGFAPAHFVSGLGAFGSDREDRDHLGPIALERAAAHARRPFRGADTVVVGDTPRDLACARAIGAVAVGVASGHHTADDLAGADLVLGSLEEADALLDLLTA